MAITYDGTKIIVVGYTAGTPANFTDIYNADVAGGWGVVSMLGTMHFKIDKDIHIGDGSTNTYFGDSSKLVSLADDFLYLALSSTTLSECTIHGVSGKYMTGSAGANPTLFELIECKIHGMRVQGYIDIISRCLFVAGAQIRFLRDTSLSRCTVVGGAGFQTRYTVTFDDIHLIDCNPYGLDLYLPPAFPSTDMTLSNIKIQNATTSSIRANNYGSIDSPNCYLINPDLDVWTFTWTNSAGAKVYRQYEFDLKVIDKDNAAINGATVKIWDKDSSLIVDTTTNASGVISSETIARGYYNAANGDTLQEASPHLIKIEKAGYTMYEADFTLEDKTDWLIALQPAGILRNPPMTGGMV